MTGPTLFSPTPRRFDTAAAGSPACSVVMTSYADTRFLREAVDSVLAQDFADFELIVVDDGSPDPAPVAALPALDPRIRVLRLESNCGTAEAANRGIALARAPIIARLDSDDVAEPGWLTAVLGALHADPELGLVGSAVTEIDAAGHPLRVQPMPECDAAIRFTLLFHSPFTHSTTAYRRALFDAVGGYRADQPVAQDHYLWAAMLPLTRARNLPEPLVHYRLNPDGLTASNASGHPVQRTRPIRVSAWAELGLDYPLDDPATGEAASAILRGRPIPDPARRQAAVAAIETALRRVEAQAPHFVRAGEQAEADRFFAEIAKRLVEPGPPAPSLTARARRFIRRKGLGGAATELARRARLRWFPPRASGTMDSVMAALHEVSPYTGFDPRGHPVDAHGWGSDDPVFRELIAELRPGLIVEVGSWKGASALHMASLVREFALPTRIVCIDTWLGSSEHLLGRKPEWRASLRLRHGYPQLYYTFLANVVRARQAERIVPLPATSDAAAIVLAEKRLVPQLVYIDGAHEEDAVRRDLEAYWPLLAPGGALIGDDFASFPGVRRAAQAFAAAHGLPLEDHGEKFVLRKPPAAA